MQEGVDGMRKSYSRCRAGGGLGQKYSVARSSAAHMRVLLEKMGSRRAGTDTEQICVRSECEGGNSERGEACAPGRGFGNLNVLARGTCTDITTLRLAL